MSATVTYKGATLTTATNQTRTLDTAGTYLEDDITITDVTTIPTGTKNISITANGTTTEDVTSYASASITANVPNSYTASDEGKVVSNGSLVSQTSATYTDNDTYDTTLVDEVTVNVSGGGADLSWLAASTPTPNVRNFFQALADGTAEHGEFTLASTPTSFITLFTMTNFSETNTPQGIIFIDKDFYQGISGLPNNASEAFAMCWMDKSFINPASDSSETLKYVAARFMINQNGTAVNNIASVGFVPFDGTTSIFRAYWQISGNDLQVKHQYGNNDQYCAFLRNRAYIWIAY